MTIITFKKPGMDFQSPESKATKSIPTIMIVMIASDKPLNIDYTSLARYLFFQTIANDSTDSFFWVVILDC